MASKETLEQFGACWEGLEVPRNGNAGLYDFQELLMIALQAAASAVVRQTPTGGIGAPEILGRHPAQ